MEIWDWLTPWWNWWAGLTDLFDWEAIAALGTAIAVFIALDQAGRSARVEAQHGAGVLNRLISALEPIVYTSGILHTSNVEAGAASEIIQGRLIEQADISIKQVDLKDAARVGITDYLVGIPQALRYLEDELPAISSGLNHCSSRWLDGQIWYLAQAVEDFRQRRDTLQSGRAVSALRKWFASLQRKWFFRR